MGRRVLRALALAGGLVLVPQVSFAGGDAAPARIESYRRIASDEAIFSVIFREPSTGAPACKTLEVRVRYAWWTWWWDDVGGKVNRASHVSALDRLATAASTGGEIRFGYIGEGWKAVEPENPCVVLSNALTAHGAQSGAGEVYSLYSAP